MFQRPAHALDTGLAAKYHKEGIWPYLSAGKTW